MSGFGEWETKTEKGDWQEVPQHLARIIHKAWLAKEACVEFTLTQEDMGLRADDGSALNYRITFATMEQICIEKPGRKRQVRRRSQDVSLRHCQMLAIATCEDLAHKGCGDALTSLKARVARLVSTSAMANLNAWMRHKCPLIIHTGLGPRNKDGQNLVDLYSADTEYRSFFETTTGRGRQDVVLRRSWEERVFGNAYDKEDRWRPKYGVLNLTGAPQGVHRAVQYGTSYFVLKQSVRWRCTMTSADSCNRAATPGTMRQFAKFMEVGDFRLTDEELVKVCNRSGEQIKAYREVQIHGPIRFSQDIEKLYADDRLDSDTRRKVEEFARKNGFPVVFRSMFTKLPNGWQEAPI